MRLKLCVVRVAMAISATLSVCQAQDLHDAALLGPPVGAQAPDFSLLDQSGHRRNLESLMGPQGLVLVFFRSADW